MASDDIDDLVGDAGMLTRRGGPIVVSDIQKRQLAIFDNGVVLFVGDYRWSPEFKAIVAQARSDGHKIGRMVPVAVTALESLYREHGGAQAREGAKLDIERQVALSDLIRRASLERASDIQIIVNKAYADIRIRVFGRMKDMESRRSTDGMAIIMAAFAVASDIGSSSSLTSAMQGALTVKSGLLPTGVELIRLQYAPGSDGYGALVMRLKYEAPADEIEIDRLGYNAQHIQDISIMRKRTNGMYVLAGKVSSGKSTTLQRVLNKMVVDKNREISMFTIEEPIELNLPGAIQVPAKKNPDGTDGFSVAMKTSLRMDPNIIVLGEVRSQELASLAIQAVMTGHALWTTIHAGTALGILDRLTDLGVESWKLVDPTVIRGLVYQRLTGVLCTSCRITFAQAVAEGSLDADLATRAMTLFGKGADDMYVRGPGCPRCKLGLSGRTVVAETVLTDPTLLELYAAGDRTGMRKYWLKERSEGGLGGVPVLHHALSKVGAGICDLNEVEEEVDLLDVYERDFMFLRDRLLRDVADLEGKT